MSDKEEEKIDYTVKVVQEGTIDVLIWVIFISCVLFVGEPSLYDAAMHFLMK